MQSRVSASGLSVGLVLGVAIGCSGLGAQAERCRAIPRGTSVGNLPADPTPWMVGLFPDYAPDGSVIGTDDQLLTCCSFTPDGGCGVDCATYPRMDVFRLGAPYAGGTCGESDLQSDGTQCWVYAIDGGVVWSNWMCDD